MKFKNLGKRIATTGLAAAMVFAMSGAPVFAATQVDDVNAVSTDGSAKIGKTLQMAAQGVDNPTFTFNFKFTPITAHQTTTTTGEGDEQTSTTTWDLGITKSSTTKTGQSVEVTGTPSTTNKGILTAQTANATFTTSDFTNGAGVYGYIVEETNTVTTKVNGSDTAWSGDSNHVLTMDTTKYLVRIKVIQGTSGLEIAGISAAPITSTVDTSSTVTASTSISTGDKKDGSTEEGGTSGTIPFTNRYTEYANDDGTSGSENNGLVISKSVTGQGSNTSDTFTFRIKFTKDANNLSSAIGATTTTDLATTKTTAGKDLYNAQACAEGNKVTAESLEYSTDYYFQLTGSGSDQIAFKVPAGTTYEVEEVDNGEYTSVKTTTVTDGGTGVEATNKTVNSYVGDGVNTVAYENTKTANPLTGIVNNYGGLIAVVAIAGIGVILVMVRRRRYDA